MTGNHFHNIAQLEDSLWEAADQLRANSKLTSSEYCMPVLGIIFLRHATNRYNTAVAQIETDQAVGQMPKRPLIQADFLKRRALMLPQPARYDEILKLPKGTNLGTALVEAMNAIEKSFEPLVNQLPKDYEKFDNDLLEHILRIFDSETLRTAAGDVFGRIYEYFLMKFAMQGAQDNGEFFTPPSLVQTIVNVIEPDHGVVADLACGSGGMFVQTSHFLEDRGEDTMKRVTFYGQEKTATTIRLAKMNLAVHGLEGDIREANTFYDDVHRLPDGKPLWGRCDFVMANPPFNVDMVDAEKVKEDRRLPFGLPGTNKAKKVPNANYLWISYFHSYLAPKGRAGFVMSSQASSSNQNDDQEVRRKIIETGAVDVMISIRSNFFYTRTVPCELWFFDKGKPAERRDQILMLDARQIFRKVTRKIYDFSPEQLANLTAVVWLYRGERRRFIDLLLRYRAECAMRLAQFHHGLHEFRGQQLASDLEFLLACLHKVAAMYLAEDTPDEKRDALIAAQRRLSDSIATLRQEATRLYEEAETHRSSLEDAVDLDEHGEDYALGRVKCTLTRLDAYAEQTNAFVRELAAGWKDLEAALNEAEALMDPDFRSNWRKEWAVRRRQQDCAFAFAEAPRAESEMRYYMRQLHWLLQRFPEGLYCDVAGLCKILDSAAIALADWSLTPGRYVGIAAPEEDEDFDFEQTMKDIHAELSDLDAEAAQLAQRIQENLAAVLG